MQAQKAFLNQEFILLSINAAFATRDKQWPIYRKDTAHHKTSVRSAARAILEKTRITYGNTVHDVDSHIHFIAAVADELTERLGDQLHNRRFRFGISQKMVNLYLKYLWAAGLNSMPFHCPVDGIIRDAARLNYDWTKSDSHEEYALAMRVLNRIAADQGMAVAEWELKNFKRRLLG